MFSSPIEYDPPVYRPPSEGRSILIPVTKGCSHNKCTYCNMYRSKKYSERTIEDIESDIIKLSQFYKDSPLAPRKAFLLDGDALGAPFELLLEVLSLIKEHLPRVTRVGTYATATNMLEKSTSELETLVSNGLSIVYLGMESGSDKVLKRIVKGNTNADMVEASLKIRAAGAKLSNIAMLGIGGREHSKEHVGETARVISETTPEFFSVLVTTAVPGTPYYTMVEREQTEPLTVKELLTEMRDILAKISINSGNIVFRANHVSNMYPVGGTLPKDQKRLVEELTAWVAECPEGTYPDSRPERM